MTEKRNRISGVLCPVVTPFTASLKPDAGRLIRQCRWLLSQNVGLAVFGTRDGRVTCLRATDGQLVWRFRAAPIEQRIMVDGRLESAWPVHGSVLVQTNVVRFAAGWHTGLDGGVTTYELELQSGKVLKASISSDDTLKSII